MFATIMRRVAAPCEGTDWHPQGEAGITFRLVPMPLTAPAQMGFNAAVNSGVAMSARSELRRRWGAVAMLAVLVCIGGGSTIAAIAGARRTQSAFPRMLRATHRPTLGVLGATDTGFTDLDPALLDRVMQIDGVTGAAEFAFMAVAPAGTPNFFTLALLDERGEPEQPLPLDGVSAPELPTLGADQVVLNEAMSQLLDKHTGDTIDIESYTQDEWLTALSTGGTTATAGGPRLTVRVAGTARSPEDVSDAPDPFFIFPPAFFAKHQDAIGNCQCDVEITADPSRLDAIAAQLATIYPTAEISPTEDLSVRIADTVALQRRAWWVIAAVAAVATIVALFQATGRVNRLLTTGDNSRRAIGMTTRELRLARFAVIAPAVVIGALLAMAVAYLLSPLAPVGLTRLAEPAPGLRWDSSPELLGALVVSVVCLLVAAAAMLLARVSADRLPPAGTTGGPTVSLGNRFAFGPARGALLGVLLAIAGLVGGLTVEHSLRHVLQTPALFGADFDASNFLSGGEDKHSLGERAAADPDVDAVAVTWTHLGSTTAIKLTGPAGSTSVEPLAYESLKGTVSVKQTLGHVPSRPDEVAMGRALMNTIGAKVGDRVTVEGPKGTVDLTISGDNLDPGVDVSGRGFALTLDGLSSIADGVVQGTVIRFAPHANRAALFARYAPMNFTPVTAPSEVLHIGQLGGLPSRVGELLAILGLVALLNAIVLSLRVGRREVALHRALGFTSEQVVRVHLWASSVVAVLGVALGGGVGFVVGRAIERKLVNDVGAVPRTILPGSVAIVGGATVAICLCSGIVMSGIALRRRPGAELRTE